MTQLRKVLMMVGILCVIGTVCATSEEDTGSAGNWFINTLCYGGQSDIIDELINDLWVDATSEREYVAGVYDCTNYAVNLTLNLSETYEAGLLVKMPKNVGVLGHMMSWVMIGDERYVIEPQNDVIYSEDMFDEFIADDDHDVIVGGIDLGVTYANTTTGRVYNVCGQ